MNDRQKNPRKHPNLEFYAAKIPSNSPICEVDERRPCECYWIGLFKYRQMEEYYAHLYSSLISFWLLHKKRKETNKNQLEEDEKGNNSSNTVNLKKSKTPNINTHLRTIHISSIFQPMILSMLYILPIMIHRWKGYMQFQGTHTHRKSFFRFVAYILLRCKFQLSPMKRFFAEILVSDLC